MLKYILLFSVGLAFSNCIHFREQEEAEKVITPFILPAPSGKFGVGRHWFSLVDESRSKKQISLLVYYPATKDSTEAFIFPTANWQQQYQPVVQKKLGDGAGSTLVYSKAVFANNSPIAQKEKFPLILFSPGMGWSTLEYSFIIQELVSQGYIVVAINSATLSPLLQMPAGNFIEEAKVKDRYQAVADDILFVWSQLKEKKETLHEVFGHTDVTTIALAGHSLGGAAALLAAHNEQGIKAVVNMDGDLLDASKAAYPVTNVLFLNQIPSGFENKSFEEMKEDNDIGWRYRQMAQTASRSNKGLYISIQGMNHSNFQDYALYPRDLIPGNIRKKRLGPIDGTTCLHLITRTLITYFDETLKGQQADWGKAIPGNAAWKLMEIK